MNICSLVISYYSWEMSTNRYAKIQKSIAIHHWLSCIAAMTIIYLDRFSPLITWYAIIGLFSAGIPINAALFLRASATDYKIMGPHIKRGLRFAAYWYLCHLLILFIGACVIITNQWLSGYYDGNAVRIILFCFTILSMFAFLYNDIITLRALFQLAVQKYSVLGAAKKKSNSKTKNNGNNNKNKASLKNQKSLNRWEVSATRPGGVRGDPSIDPQTVLKIGAYEYSQLTINSNNPNFHTTNNLVDYDPDSYWYEAYPISGTRTDFSRQIHNGQPHHTNIPPMGMGMIGADGWIDETTQTSIHDRMGPSNDYTQTEFIHNGGHQTQPPSIDYSQIEAKRTDLTLQDLRADTDNYSNILKLAGMMINIHVFHNKLVRIYVNYFKHKGEINTEREMVLPTYAKNASIATITAMSRSNTIATHTGTVRVHGLNRAQSNTTTQTQTGGMSSGLSTRFRGNSNSQYMNNKDRQSNHITSTNKNDLGLADVSSVATIDENAETMASNEQFNKNDTTKNQDQVINKTVTDSIMTETPTLGSGPNATSTATSYFNSHNFNSTHTHTPMTALTSTSGLTMTITPSPQALHNGALSGTITTMTTTNPSQQQPPLHPTPTQTEQTIISSTLNIQKININSSPLKKNSFTTPLSTTGTQGNETNVTVDTDLPSHYQILPDVLLMYDHYHHY